MDHAPNPKGMSCQSNDICITTHQVCLSHAMLCRLLWRLWKYKYGLCKRLLLLFSYLCLIHILNFSQGYSSMFAMIKWNTAPNGSNRSVFSNINAFLPHAILWLVCRIFPRPGDSLTSPGLQFLKLYLKFVKRSRLFLYIFIEASEKSTWLAEHY